MTAEKQNNKMSKTLIGLLILISVLPVGLLGGFIGSSSGNHSFATGFLWGIGVAVVGFAVIAFGMFTWEWIKKEAEKGKLLPFIIVGVAVAVAISGYLAISLGDPTCIETETDNRGSYCLEYADDGYEPTSEQKWDKFWSALPVTVTIASLIAVIVRNHMEKEKK